MSIVKGGKGAILSRLEKQKLNTDSSTVAKLAGTHQFSWRIMLAVMFLECQGCEAQENVMHQDDKSAILLEKNGCASASKRTRAVNVRCFQIKDHMDKKQLEVKHCRTDDMIRDCMTKGPQGHKFSEFGKAIVGMEQEQNDARHLKNRKWESVRAHVHVSLCVHDGVIYLCVA